MSLGRPYRTIWTAAAISNLGDGVVITAVPLLAVRLTHDPLLIAGVAVAERLPWLLFSLISGAIVDRTDRKWLMGTVDIARGALMVFLSAAVFGHWLRLPVLYVVVFAMGIAETLFDNASQAMMPAVVQRDQLERANARLYAAQIVTNEFVGPPLGGILFVFAATAPFMLDAGSFFIAAALVLALRGRYRAPEQPKGTPHGLRTEIAEGLRWLWSTPIVRRMAISLGAFNFLWNGAMSIFVLFALSKLHLAPSRFGFLLAAGAAGSLVGSFIGPRVSRALGGTTLVWVGIASAVSIGVTGLLSNVWIAGVLLALSAAAGVIWNVVTVSLRKSMIPDHLLGRVNSAYRLIGWGAIPVGAFVAGVIAKALGLRAPFLIAGGTLLVVTLGYFTRMVPDIRAIRVETQP